MPEEALETQELREKLEQAQEHAEAHGKHEKHGGGGPSWILALSLSTALTAVVAAVASLESGSFANEAIIEKNDAILQQSRADDGWAYYQAKSIKSTVYAAQAEVARETASGKPELAASLDKEAKRLKDEQGDLEKDAKEHEAKAAEDNRTSEEKMHRHHQFASSVTIFQVAIALSAIAALTRKKAVWWVSLVAGIGGLVYFARGFL